MNWLDSIFDRLKELWPLVIVYSYERGVRFRRGTDIATLGPGLHFKWWWIEDILKESIVEQTMDLVTQSVTTKDGLSVSFSCNIVYIVTDVRKLLTCVHSFHSSVDARARIHLARAIRRRTWMRLHRAQAAVERSLTDTLTTRLAGWGVQVVEVGLTDCVQAIQLRHFGDPQQQVAHMVGANVA